jgi:outer membrane protein assembly factor BamB
VPWLPDRLPVEPKFLWQKSLSNQGLGGIAATSDFVLTVDRDVSDTSDLFHCFAAETGMLQWTLNHPASGRLDYGNSPRATPLIYGELVYLLGAFGDLHCVDLESGAPLWQQNIRKEFDVHDKLVWGTASSPLIVDEQLIVNPGAADASLIALDPETGDVLWKTPGASAAFSSFVVGKFGDRRQIIGYDKESLGGWDVKTGERLWKHVAKNANDFNVPTPIIVGDKLVLTTENNGTRLHEFDSRGHLIDVPQAMHRNLAPDSHTPLVLGDRLFGVWSGLFCLDLTNNLNELWDSDDDAFNHYATVIGSRDRVLITTEKGELILLDATADKFAPLSRLKLFENDSGVFSHPAVVGSRLFVRSSESLVCLALA